MPTRPTAPAPQSGLTGFPAALARIGGEAPDRFRWLAEFAERALKSRADVEAAADDLAAFGFWSLHEAYMASGIAPEADEEVGKRIDRRVPVALLVALRRLNVRAMQRRVQSILEQLQTRGHYETPYRVQYGVWSAGRPLFFIPSSAGSNLFEGAIAATLQQVAPLLRRCKRRLCRKLFVRQGRQDYCSPACSQTTRSAKFFGDPTKRARHLARRRKRYENQVRKKHPNAKVTRRPGSGRRPRDVGP
jgi:hypothetical protein